MRSLGGLPWEEVGDRGLTGESMGHRESKVGSVAGGVRMVWALNTGSEVPVAAMPEEDSMDNV